MSVYRPKGRKHFYYRFQWRGHKFHGPTGATTKRAAERVEARERSRLIAERCQPRDTVFAIAARWWAERGRHRKDANDVEYRLARVVEHLGPDRSVFAVVQGDVAGYVATRRTQPIQGALKGQRLTSPASINRELEVFRAAWLYAAKSIEGLPRIDISAERLEEPPSSERILSEAEEKAIFSELRLPYRPFFAAALITGWRFSTGAALLWKEVMIDRIDTRQKRGRRLLLPISDALRALLDAERGKHPKHVFTIQAHATRDGRQRGRHYPVTYSQARAEWARACRAAIGEVVNIHQLRHTAGTRLWLATGDIFLAQKLLGHSTVRTTERYAHASADRLRDAMERVAARSPDQDAHGPVAKCERGANRGR